MSCSKAEKMDIKPVFTIDGSFEAKTVEDYSRKFTVVSDIEVDNDGNIYLFNPKMEKVLKYDRDGKFVKYFGKRGTLKEEFLNAMDFVILNDTLYFKNTFTQIMIKYTLDGQYAGDFFYKDGKFQIGEIIRAVSNDKVVGYISSAEKDSNDIIFKNKLVLMNNRFEETATLREYSTLFDRNDPKFFEMITKYASGGGNIYVAENEEDQYRISIYDLEGKKSGEIKKDYTQIEYNDIEIEKIKALPISKKVTKDEVDTLQTRITNKKSINNIFYDKYGRLLVCPSIKRNEKNQNDFIADVFENGKYVKTIMIPQLKGEDFLHRFDSEIYFIGSRIYEVLHKEMKVNVYEY
jgi:hypothetical protein